MWDGVKFTPPRQSEYRTNRYNDSMVHHEIDFADVDRVPGLFVHLQNQLGGRCVDLQFIFDGSFPKSELKKFGFSAREGESRIWFLAHPTYRIAAIHLETTQSWILEIIKRSGRGVLIDAARLEFLKGSGTFGVQLTFPMDVSAT